MDEWTNNEIIKRIRGRLDCTHSYFDVDDTNHEQLLCDKTCCECDGCGED